MPSRRWPVRPATAVAWLVAAALAVAGCTGGQTGSDDLGAPSTSGVGTGRIAVVAAFYPLEYAVAQVGGDHVEVSSLTKPGVEPHDLELTSQDVARVGAAQLVVYLEGLQPAVDAVVAQEAGSRVLEVSAAADLDLPAPAGLSAHGGADPHFWLDPIRMYLVAGEIGERLAELDPAHAADYRANVHTLAGPLYDIDSDYWLDLASCTNRHLVTSHAAFGYLARRYGFTQVPIAGISPDQEPSARHLADVAETVRDTKATTIYTETLVDAKYAQTIAATTGASVAVLDPAEGVTASSPGSDYAQIMRANLSALRAGQGCP
jgi:zinc transport system substrate-binding protein